MRFNIFIAVGTIFLTIIARASLPDSTLQLPVKVKPLEVTTIKFPRFFNYSVNSFLGRPIIYEGGIVTSSLDNQKYFILGNKQEINAYINITKDSPDLGKKYDRSGRYIGDASLFIKQITNDLKLHPSNHDN